MCIIYSDVKTYEYKIFCINATSLSYSFKKLGLLHYSRYLKHLAEIDSDFVDIYHEIKMYIAVKGYKNNVKQLKELRDLEVLKELEINEIKEKAKIQLNELEIEENEEVDNLKFELEYGSEKNRYFK